MKGFRGSDLKQDDVPRLEKQADRIRAVMASGEWMTIPEVKKLAQVRMDATVSRIVRYMREPKFGGYTIEKRLRAPGLWEYRALRPPAEKDGQFLLFSEGA